MKLNDPQHPYTKYGLALVNVKNHKPAAVTAEMLDQAISDGLNRFRLKTDDFPGNTNLLHYDYLKERDFDRNPKLIQSPGLKDKGIYLAPTIIAEETSAKNTYAAVKEIKNDLKSFKNLNKTHKFTRSIAPTSAKINNGKKTESDQSGTLYEAACAAIATICEEKPASWANGLNTTIIPDLPLDELIDFIELFDRMIHDQLVNDLFVAKVERNSDAETSVQKERRRRKTTKPTNKSGYKRPPIFFGNYPFAPRNSVFGAVGLLGAIGKWARRAGQIEWGRKVLNSIADRPLYLINYHRIRQVQFGHHVVRLSIDGDLYEMVNALNQTWIYSEDSLTPKWDSPKYQLFFLMASRFLQLFSAAAFADMLAIRAEYQPQLYTLFKEYFMEKANVRKEIVESARELGAWLNSVAYVAAMQEVGDEKSGSPDAKREKIKKAKAKALVELESSAMGARTPSALLAQVITRAGRLSNTDAPSAASKYMDAVVTGEIDLQTAKQLMIAFARLSTYKDANDKVAVEDDYPIPPSV